MLFRYGEDRNLTFVLPQKPISFHWPQYFHLSNIMPLYTEQGRILCCHTRYNKGPVNLLFPKNKSKYFTILRNPINHFESVFNYFKFFDALRLRNHSNPIRSFLRDPPAFNRMNFNSRQFLYLIRNPSMFNLGLNHKYFQNRSAVMRFITFVDQEFDLILINEYFDESLILLKNLLCWDFVDILYVKQKVRGQKTRLSREMKANILSWNQADALLYDHFNRTLWRKILQAGPKFYDDLRLFREKNKILEENCAKFNRRILAQNENEPNKYLQICTQLSRKTRKYIAYMKGKMERKWRDSDKPVPEDYASPENSWDIGQHLKYKPISHDE